MYEDVLLAPGIKIKTQHHIEKKPKRVKVVKKRNKKQKEKSRLETTSVAKGMVAGALKALD